MYSNNNFVRCLSLVLCAVFTLIMLLSNSAGAFTILTPRQPLTSVPFAINAKNVSGGYVQLPLTMNAPSSADCNESSEYGQSKVDAVNNRLYICTATGWKSSLLQ